MREKRPHLGEEKEYIDSLARSQWARLTYGHPVLEDARRRSSSFPICSLKILSIQDRQSRSSGGLVSKGERKELQRHVG